MTPLRAYLAVVLVCLAAYTLVVGLGILALFGGMMFLAPYLLWAIARARGNAAVLLLGAERAGR